MATSAEWVENIKSTWGLLASFAIFIFGIVGSFVLPPPGWVASGGSTTLINFAKFVVAALAGLILILVHKWNKRNHLARWTLVAIGSLVLSLLAYFAYQHLLDTRTCKYFDEVVVIGGTYTQHAQSYVRGTPNASCSVLLEDFAGKADDVWTQDSINKSRYVLALAYISCIPLFTICIISIVQALYCITQDSAKVSRSQAARRA